MKFLSEFSKGVNQEFLHLISKRLPCFYSLHYNLTMMNVTVKGEKKIKVRLLTVAVLV